MITLFPDQEIAVDGLRRSMAAGKTSPLLVAPCAFGKTVCFSYLCSRLNSAGKRAVVLVHRDELVQQCCDTLKDFGVQHGRIVAGAICDPRPMTHVASVFSLARRLDHYKVPDYVIIDEAHHCVTASTWGRVIAYWRERNPKIRVIGVTATPVRLSGEGLGQVFDDMILGPSTADLIDAGRLSKYVMFAPQRQVDMSGLHMRGGDYVRSEVAGRMDKPTITGSAVAHYRKCADGMPAVVFCCSVEHAHHTAERFKGEGYQFVAIDGGMSMEDRRKAIRDFERSQLHGLTSCSLVDEGFNIPGIVAAIDLAPTQSLSRCIQRWGRALRVAPGKERAVILDHAGNSSLHGLPDDDRAWSLDGEAQRKAKKVDPDALPIKQCKKCYAVARATAAVCASCGEVFVVKARKIEEVEGELQEVDPAAARQAARMEQAAAKSRDALAALAKSTGRSEGWADHVLLARQEKERLRDEARRVLAEAGDMLPERVLLALKPKQLRTLIEERRAA